MAVIQIPNLPVAISIDGQELLECVQGGVSRRVNIAQIWNGISIGNPTPPITITNDYTVASNDYSIICNGSGTITITLPVAYQNAGRVIYIKTVSPYSVVSIGNNVCPINSLTASSFILSNVRGSWAMLQSDGSNWITLATNNAIQNVLIWES